MRGRAGVDVCAASAFLKGRMTPHPPLRGTFSRKGRRIRCASSTSRACALKGWGSVGARAIPPGYRRRRPSPVAAAVEEFRRGRPCSARSVLASAAVEGSSSAGSGGDPICPPPQVHPVRPRSALAQPTTGEGRQKHPPDPGLSMPRQPRDRPRCASGSWAQDAFPSQRDAESLRPVSGMLGRLARETRKPGKSLGLAGSIVSARGAEPAPSPGGRGLERTAAKPASLRERVRGRRLT
jgi:hypothetical protein